LRVAANSSYPSQGVVDLGFENYAVADFLDTLRLTILQRENELQDRFRLGLRDNHDAVSIPDHDITRHYHGVAAGDRHVDLAGTVLVARTGANRPAEGWETQTGERLDITDRTVHYQSAKPGGDGGISHQLAKYRAARVSTGIDQDDVSGSCDFHGFVNHEVVTGAGQNGHSHAAKRHACPHLNAH
jgi:hypothetical protein